MLLLLLRLSILISNATYHFLTVMMTNVDDGVNDVDDDNDNDDINKYVH